VSDTRGEPRDRLDEQGRDGLSPSRHESATPASAAAVAVDGLRKRYGGVVALDGMNLAVQPGTIHAVVGENGAGKSSLMKILAGVESPDAGTISLDGVAVSLGTPKVAQAHRIGIVFQELSLFPDRSVLANLFVNDEPTRLGFISHRLMRRRAAPLLARVGLQVDVSAPVRDLSVGERQLVELCRVLGESPRLLILDEPNSALSGTETARLFAVLRELRQGGITVLYVSHRLEEVFEIADRITVMRNGREVMTRDRAGLNIADVVRAMVGRSEDELFPPPLEAAGPSRLGRLSVRDVSVKDRLAHITFSVEAGEILGLAGLHGSGVSDLLGLLFGTQRPESGDINFPDGQGVPNSPTSAVRRGISLVPADRRRQGLMLEKSTAANIAHVAVGTIRSRSFWLAPREVAEMADRQIRSLQIKTPSPWTTANALSGGNQQKIVLGKWLEVRPSVVLLDDPTRGVDVGAKREIYQLIRRLASEGRMVLFSSTELPELVGLCDRILVFYRGRLAGECTPSSTDSRRLLHAINTGNLHEQA
jgi:ribose transport system ATP-binding protein